VYGTAAAVAAAVLRGAHVVRVHDVKEMREVVEVAYAIRGEMAW
jgi:dihydropteroate synthase